MASSFFSDESGTSDVASWQTSLPAPRGPFGSGVHNSLVRNQVWFFGIFLQFSHNFPCVLRNQEEWCHCQRPLHQLADPRRSFSHRMFRFWPTARCRYRRLQAFDCVSTAHWARKQEKFAIRWQRSGGHLVMAGCKITTAKVVEMVVLRCTCKTWNVFLHKSAHTFSWILQFLQRWQDAITLGSPTSPEFAVWQPNFSARLCQVIGNSTSLNRKGSLMWAPLSREASSTKRQYSWLLIVGNLPFSIFFYDQIPMFNDSIPFLSLYHKVKSQNWNRPLKSSLYQ